MRKALVIAARDYAAAVRTKAFVLGLVLLPVMMFGSLFVSRATRDIKDTSDKRVVVIDRTPGQAVFPTLKSAAEARNASDVIDAESGRQKAAKFFFESVEPVPGDDPAAVEAQRFELSERVRRNEIFSFVEIGKDVLSPALPAPPSTQAVEEAREAAAGAGFDIDARIAAAAKAMGEHATIRYSSNRPTFGDIRAFVQEKVAVQASMARAAALKLNPAQVMAAARPPLVAPAPLYFRDSGGGIRQESRQGEFMSVIMPFMLMMLLFLVVILGASPLSTNVVEEKQLRIAEVLLGSVRPFDLMLGKLLGGVGVALTLAAVYMGGGYFGVKELGLAKYLSPLMITMFLIFVVLATMMYGALFVAAGAAVTNMKEAQSLITPIMLLVMLPVFFFGPVLNDPNGPIARALTFFPLSAPMMTVMRLGIPPRPAGWEVALAAGITLVTTLVIVWAAGRIFRVGILMQGQAARPAQLLKWVFTG